MTTVVQTLTWEGEQSEHLFDTNISDQPRNPCCFVLFSDITCVIIPMYLKGSKGGTCDHNGRSVTYRRGGSKEDSYDTLYRQKEVAPGGHTGNKTRRWYMASERIRCERLSQQTSISENRRKLAGVNTPVMQKTALMVWTTLERPLIKGCGLSQTTRYGLFVSILPDVGQGVKGRRDAIEAGRRVLPKMYIPHGIAISGKAGIV